LLLVQLYANIIKKRCCSFAQIQTIHFRPHVEAYFSYVHCDTERTPTAQNKTSAWDDTGTAIETRPGKQLHHLALRSGCQKPRNTGQRSLQNCACVKLQTIRTLSSRVRNKKLILHIFSTVGKWWTVLIKILFLSQMKCGSH